MTADIDIVGGGIGGLAAALAFARQGRAVTLFEQSPELREAGAGIQITPNGARPLEALGLRERLEAEGIRAEALEPMDGLTGRRIARFPLGTPDGPPYRFFHRADLLRLLADAAREAGVAVRTGVRVEGIGADGVLSLPEGERRPALAVGAEGLHSRLRAVLNGEDRPFFTGQVAWRAVVPGEGPPVARIWMFPGRHVVTYPLSCGRMNLVAVREQAVWAPEGWTHDDTPEALRAAFPDAAPPLVELFDRIGDLRLWGLFRHLVATHWHGPAAAILGDAAHPTLPFLAQGANLAIEDAWVLAAEVGRRPLDAALAAYEAARAPRVRRAIAEANANARRYHLGGPQRAVAHLGLRAIGRVAPGAFVRRLDWLYRHDVTRSG